MTISIRSKTSIALTPEDLTAFAKLRIDKKILAAAKVERISDKAARASGFVYGNPLTDSLAGVVFSYPNAEGDVLNRRIRRDNCSEDEKGDPIAKYVSLPKVKAIRTLYALPHDWKRWAANRKLVGLLVEAEKSQLAISSWAARTGYPLVVFAMGGKDGWHGLDLSLFAGRRVGVMLDANVWTKAQVQRSELELVAALRTQYKADGFVCRVKAAPGVNGPDDFIGKNTDAAFRALLEAPSIEPWLTGLGASWQEWQDAQPPKFIIKDFLQDSSATLIAGLSGDGKTWMLINIVWSLLTGNALFDHFKVVERATRVIYLTPENMLGAIKYRMEKFSLGKFVQSGQLVVRSLEYPRLPLTDPALLLAAKGSDIFLDTIVRFQQGDENSNSDNARGLSEPIFRVMGAGARLLVGAAHAPKSFSDAEHMTLENAVRGGGDIGAMLGTAWALKMDSSVTTTRVLVKNIKPRDMEPVREFVLVGRPYIDAGLGFRMEIAPGNVAPGDFERSKKKQQKVGRKKDDKKMEREKLLRELAGKPFEEVKAAVEQHGWNLADGTLKKEISQIASATRIAVGATREKF